MSGAGLFSQGMMVTTVGEEKLHNPRLTKKVEEYVKIMEGLGLAYPKKIDESMSANMECGEKVASSNFQRG